MDLEMPGGESMRFWRKAQGSRRTAMGPVSLRRKRCCRGSLGKIAPATIDDNVGRILRVMFESGVFDKPIASGQVDTPAHRALARKAAQESMCCSRTRAASFR